MYRLLLASKSPSRRKLLDIAKIPYVLYEHGIDERACSWALPMEELVISLARQKMEAIQYDSLLPMPENNGILFVLTADTLTQDCHGTIHGKPSSCEEALAMFAAFREGEARIATGFRLERRVWNNGAWHIEMVHEEAVTGSCLFSISERRAREYMQNAATLSCAGGMEIEGYGAQFVQRVTGSYTAIIGLPLFELQSALEGMGFYSASGFV